LLRSARQSFRWKAASQGAGSVRAEWQQAEMLTSEGLEKARSVLKAKPEGRSVLKAEAKPERAD
jgi:hypothetical protein